MVLIDDGNMVNGKYNKQVKKYSIFKYVLYIVLIISFVVIFLVLS